jgi:hypothetical protein
MPKFYTYEIETSAYDGTWESEGRRESRSDLDRHPDEVARAVLEGWVMDHPDDVDGGVRMQVFGDDPGDYPPDDLTNVRVFVFEGKLDDHDERPAAAAYLVNHPGDD